MKKLWKNQSKSFNLANISNPQNSGLIHMQDLTTQKKALRERIKSNNSDRHALMIEALKMCGVEDAERFIVKGLPQSELFMSEVIARLHRLYLPEPENTFKTVLDVGPQNFAGTALLHSIHGKYSFNRLKLGITALDITDTFELLKDIIAPNVEFLVQDIFDIKQRSWDTVICSHVIEHVPNPQGFVRQLQSLAKDFVIVGCPWNEDPLVTRTHINTLKKDFMLEVGARDLEIFTNYCWGKDREVCLFWLPGLAK